MAKKLFRVILLLLILASIVAALYYWFGRSMPVSVKVKPVEYGTVEDTVANTRAGTIRACRRAGISPRVGGQIASMPVKEGDRVEPGQILMEFWNDDLSARVNLAESEIRSASAKAEQACVLAQVAEREARRLKQLKKQKLAAEEAVDKADGEARAQKAACTAAKAVVQVGQAKLDVALAALDQTQLKAPFAGIVAEVNGEVGEFVTPSPVGLF
jgi:HlyD family secretion protein